MQLIYRHAMSNDLEKISELVRFAVMQMDRQGIKQWDELYPTSEDFERDIEKNIYMSDKFMMKSPLFSS